VASAIITVRRTMVPTPRRRRTSLTRWLKTTTGAVTAITGLIVAIGGLVAGIRSLNGGGGKPSVSENAHPIASVRDLMAGVWRDVLKPDTVLSISFPVNHRLVQVIVEMKSTDLFHRMTEGTFDGSRITVSFNYGQDPGKRWEFHLRPDQRLESRFFSGEGAEPSISVYERISDVARR
jgi:hypothetical protein